CEHPVFRAINRRGLCIRLLDSRAVAYARDDPQPEHVARLVEVITVTLGCGDGERYVHIDRLLIERGKALRSNSDNRVFLFSQVERAPQRRTLAPKMALPERIAQNHDGLCCAPLLLRLREETADVRFHAERREKTGRGERPANLLCTLSATERAIG